MNNNNEIGDYDLGGTFIFGNVTYSKCSISLNGFIYFGNVGVFYTFNPFADIIGKRLQCLQAILLLLQMELM